MSFPWAEDYQPEHGFLRSTTGPVLHGGAREAAPAGLAGVRPVTAAE